jgi:hypothetical protein
MTQADVARLTVASLRTVGAVEGDDARERALERHIEEFLGEGPTRTAEATVSHFAWTPPSVVERTVAALAGEDRLALEPVVGQARYRVDRRNVSVLGTDPALRLAGLHHQMDILSAGVQTRLLAGGRNSAARMLSFVAAPQALGALLASPQQTLRAACTSVEDA